MSHILLRNSLVTNPDFASVIALLESNKLVTADLAAADMDYFVGCSDVDGLSGVIGMQPCGEAGLLRSLAVRPDARGMGLGSALVAALEAIARQNKLVALYLLTEDAQRYFAKQGFNEIDRRDTPAEVKRSSQFDSLCPDTATVMYKCPIA